MKSEEKLMAILTCSSFTVSATDVDVDTYGQARGTLKKFKLRLI